MTPLGREEVAELEGVAVALTEALAIKVASILMNWLTEKLEEERGSGEGPKTGGTGGVGSWFIIGDGMGKKGLGLGLDKKVPKPDERVTLE